MRTARRTIGLAVAVVALAAGVTGAALVPQQAHAQVPPGIGVTCDALATVATQLSTARERAAAAAAVVQQRLAQGGLTPRQAALLRAQLALLRLQVALLDAAIARVEAWRAQFCGGSSPPPPPPPPAPPAPPPPPPPPPGE